MNRPLFVLATAISSCVLLAATGCDSGPPTGTVTGVVTMDGEPLDSALVTFVPKEGGQSALGKTNEVGEYELYRRGEPGALLGPYKVTVTTLHNDSPDSPLQAPSDSEAYMQQAMGGGSASSARARTSPKERIPPRYNKNSELSQTVKEGENIVNLELTSR